jgi:hypothetical protein
LDASKLALLWDHWNDFQSIRRRFDPNAIFMTPYLNRLFESTSTATITAPVAPTVDQ